MYIQILNTVFVFPSSIILFYMLYYKEKKLFFNYIMLEERTMDKIDTTQYTKEELVAKIKKDAEELYDDGTFFCSEAVVTVINNYLGQPYQPEVVKMASGFPIGMGKAGCLCGSVSGGQMALGIVYGRTQGEAMQEKMFEMSKGLHDYTMKEYGSCCCRVMTRKWRGDDFKSPERKRHCVEITGKVAEWVAEQLINDNKILAKDSE